MSGFIGDDIKSCKLWLFADSDHAGEHDNRSTSGSFLCLVGPNTYFPLSAFSKKQTSTALSSTEAEVVCANIALRSLGLFLLPQFGACFRTRGEWVKKQTSPRLSGETPKSSTVQNTQTVHYLRLSMRVETSSLMVGLLKCIHPVNPTPLSSFRGCLAAPEGQLDSGTRSRGVGRT